MNGRADGWFSAHVWLQKTDETSHFVVWTLHQRFFVIFFCSYRSLLSTQISSLPNQSRVTVIIKYSKFRMWRRSRWNKRKGTNEEKITDSSSNNNKNKRKNNKHRGEYCNIFCFIGDLLPTLCILTTVDIFYSNKKKTLIVLLCVWCLWRIAHVHERVDNWRTIVRLSCSTTVNQDIRINDRPTIYTLMFIVLSALIKELRSWSCVVNRITVQFFLVQCVSHRNRNHRYLWCVKLNKQKSKDNREIVVEKSLAVHFYSRSSSPITQQKETESVYPRCVCFVHCSVTVRYTSTLNSGSFGSQTHTHTHSSALYYYL